MATLRILRGAVRLVPFSPCRVRRACGQPSLQQTYACAAPGSAISVLNLLRKAAHWAGVLACCASFTVSRLGARLGNHTSYQFLEANSDFGTPRGGRRTVPIRNPSPTPLTLPSLTTRIVN